MSHSRKLSHSKYKLLSKMSSQNKLKILKKLEGELEDIHFSSISRFIIPTKMLCEVELYQLMLLPNSDQIKTVLRLISDSLKEGDVNKYWPNFYQALRTEYPSIADKFEAELFPENNKFASPSQSPPKEEPISPPTTTKDKIKKPVRKKDIGDPHDFRHIMHIGWSSTGGFQQKVYDPALLKAFFTKAGITEEHLGDAETRDFIFRYIEENGGEKAVQEELQETHEDRLV